MNKILFTILCRIGIHGWEMQEQYLHWKCFNCGKEKVEDYHI